MEVIIIKKLRILICTLVLSLVLTPLCTNLASANTLETSPADISKHTNDNEFTFEAEGVTYDVKRMENEKSITVTIKDNQGEQKFITDKTTGNITVTSDYLSNKELNAAEKEFKNMSDQLRSQVVNQNDIDETLLKPNFAKDQIGIQAIKGSFAWGSWKNYTVSADSKATIQIVTAAILSVIPYVGWAAGALAAIYIQYNLKTGYFSSRVGNALDTDPNYYWEKRQVRLYKDSARTNLLSDKTSDPARYLVPTS